MIAINAKIESNQSKQSYLDFVLSLSDYGTVENLGLCSDGINSIRVVHMGIGNKHIVIDGCLHGQHEWTSAYFVRKFMEYLKNPQNSPYPEHFRHLYNNYRFHFVPIVNPWGYINGPSVPNDKSNPETRYNANGVDLNRNWPEGFENTGEPKGPYPFSEPETIALKGLIETYKPLVYLNWHTYGSEGNMTEGSSNNKDVFLLHDWVSKEFNYATGESTNIGKTADTLPMSHLWVSKQQSHLSRHIWATGPEISYTYPIGEQIGYAIAYMLIYLLKIDEYINNGILL